MNDTAHSSQASTQPFKLSTLLLSNTICGTKVSQKQFYSVTLNKVMFCSSFFFLIWRRSKIIPEFKLKLSSSDWAFLSKVGSENFRTGNVFFLIYSIKHQMNSNLILLYCHSSMLNLLINFCHSNFKLVQATFSLGWAQKVMQTAFSW